MPYGNFSSNLEKRAEWDALHELIRDVTEGVELPKGGFLQCIRGDHEMHPGEIVSGIVRDLAESEIAIAVLSEHNPNVFYELGVRHALASRTILMAENPDDVPFDLRTQRMLLYSTKNLASTQKLRLELRNALCAILLQNPNISDNPIQRYLADRGRGGLNHSSGDSTITALLLEMREMRSAISDLVTERTDKPRHTESVVEAFGNGAAIEAVSVNNKSLDSGLFGYQEKMADKLSPSDDSIIEMLQGAWLNEATGSYAYAESIDSSIRCVYCYCGNDEATGVYEDFQRVGSRIFARFHWLKDAEIQGFTMLRFEEDGVLAGGWWYADSVPEAARENLPMLDEHHPAMVPVRWHKQKDLLFPKWAKDWFDS
jgi:hypothetical protein